MRSLSHFAPSLAVWSLLALAGTVHSQNTFEITIPVPGSTNVAGGQQAPDGGFVFGGEVGDGMFVLRTDSTGAVQWTRTLAESTNEEGIYNRSLAVTGDRIMMGGYAMGPNTATRDGLLHVLDLDGTVIAQRLEDVAQNSNALHSITATANGALIAGRSLGAGSYDMLMQQVDPNGVVQGSWSYGSNGWDWGYEAIPCSAGGMALVGYGDEVGGPAPSAYLVRTDAQGQELWARGIDGASADEGYSVMEDPTTGDLYVGGTSLGMGASGIRGFISKFSPDGTHQWTRVINNAFDVIGLVPIVPGRYAALLRAQNIAGGHGNYDALLVIFNGGGDVVSNRLFGTPASEYPVALSRTADGGLLITCLLSGNATNGIYAVLTTDTGGGACSGIAVEPGWAPYTPTIFNHTSTLQSGHNAASWAAIPTPLTTEREFVCCTYPVTAAFIAEPGQGLSYSFTNQSQGQGPGAATWNIIGNTFSGDVVDFTFPSTGSYQVCLNVDGLCDSDQQCEQVQVIGAGIGEYAAHPVMLTPNPATDHLRVTVPADVRTVEILDITGRLLGTWSVNGAQVLRLDVSGLPGGVHVLRATGVAGVRALRFVKN